MFIQTWVIPEYPGGGPWTPSKAIYVKQTSFGESVPSWKYLNEPSEFKINVPLLTGDIGPRAISWFESSISLDNTPISAAISKVSPSFTEYVSSIVIGKSLIGLIIIIAVDKVEQPDLSIDL